MRNMRGKQIY